MTVTITKPATPPRADVPSARAERSKNHRAIKKSAVILRFVGIFAAVVFFIFPIVWMLLASFKENVDIANPGKLLFEPTLDNYSNVLFTMDFVGYTWNSFIIAVAATGISLLVGVPAAYAVSRYKMTSVTGFILLARIIPGVSLLIPWYYIFAQIGLVGTFTSLITAHIFVSLPLIIAIMASFFDGMSIELEEAAQIDGLSKLKAFALITVRLSAPGIATSAILSFIFSWNNFLFALVLSGENTTTLPAAIFKFISYLGVDWGGLMAASVVITLPVIVVTMFLQKYIISGLTAGATKG